MGPSLVVDAAVVLAVVKDEPQAEGVAQLLSAERCRVSTVTVAEIVDVGLRSGITSERVEAVVREIESSMEVVPPDLETAALAGALRARWHARRGSRVSLADCMVLATARPGDRIATPDSALARMARGEGIDVVRLTGRRD